MADLLTQLTLMSFHLNVHFVCGCSLSFCFVIVFFSSILLYLLPFISFHFIPLHPIHLNYQLLPLWLLFARTQTHVKYSLNAAPTYTRLDESTTMLMLPMLSLLLLLADFHFYFHRRWHKYTQCECGKLSMLHTAAVDLTIIIPLNCESHQNSCTTNYL